MPEVKSLLVFPVSFSGQEAAEAERCSFASRIIYLRIHVGFLEFSMFPPALGVLLNLLFLLGVLSSLPFISFFLDEIHLLGEPFPIRFT